MRLLGGLLLLIVLAAGALPFALLYGLPYALGYRPWEALGLLVVLLAACVRSPRAD